MITKGTGMDTILYKYQHFHKEYLIYDSCKNHRRLNERAIRAICTRNFSLNVKGILEGQMTEGEEMKMNFYQPDGREGRADEAAAETFHQYLKDAGYEKVQRPRGSAGAADMVPESKGREKRAEIVGKLYLSEQFTFR